MPWCIWSKGLSLYDSDIVRQYPEMWGQMRVGAIDSRS